MFSLGVGHCGVLDERKVVGDVLVVRQPPMSPNQAVLTYCHLETERHHEGFTVRNNSLIRFLTVISRSTEPHHGVGAPLGDEGMGLILWHHGFNQRHSVTDPLQNERGGN